MIAFIEREKPTSSSAGDAGRAVGQASSTSQRAVGAVDERGRAEADRDDQQRHRRAGRGDAELLARRLGVAAELGDAAEEPQVDALRP